MINAQFRRYAARRGILIAKSRSARGGSNKGGYKITDAQTKACLAGKQYDLSDEDAWRFALNCIQARLPTETAATEVSPFDPYWQTWIDSMKQGLEHADAEELEIRSAAAKAALQAVEDQKMLRACLKLVDAVQDFEESGGGGPGRSR